jgi:hypothetical protein
MINWEILGIVTQFPDAFAAEFENTDWSSPKTAARSLIGDSPDLV